MTEPAQAVERAPHTQEVATQPTSTPAPPQASLQSSAGNQAVQRAARAESAPGTPVLWGLDTTTRNTYASVTIPGRTLAQVATYMYGSPEAASALMEANGSISGFLRPGTTLRPSSTRPLAEQATRDLNDALARGTALRTQGIPTEAPAQQLMVYRFTAAGHNFELTEGQFRALMRGLSVWITRKASFFRDRARDGRWVQRDHVASTNSVVRGISNLFAGQNVPNEMIWDIPERGAQMIIDQLATAELTPELISREARLLQIVAESVDQGYAVWHRYLERTISGAGSAVHALELTRNVSFGIAAAIAGVVAAPVVFAAAGTALTGVGVTGVTSTLLSGAVAVTAGTGAGAVTAGTLEFGSAVAGEGVAMAVTPGQQSFDFSYVGERTRAGLHYGAVQGGIGAAGVLVAPGVAGWISGRLFGVAPQALTGAGARLIVNMLTGAAVGAPSGALGTAIDGLSALMRGEVTLEEYLGRVGRGTAFGALGGVVASLIPVSGVVRPGDFGRFGFNSLPGMRPPGGAPPTPSGGGGAIGGPSNVRPITSARSYRAPSVPSSGGGGSSTQAYYGGSAARDLNLSALAVPEPVPLVSPTLAPAPAPGVPGYQPPILAGVGAGVGVSVASTPAPVPAPDPEEDPDPHRTQIVTLRLPRVKAVHQAEYERLVASRTLVHYSNYDRPQTGQRRVWLSGIRPGAREGMFWPVYWRGERLGLSHVRILLPDWSRHFLGVPMEVDHIIELQVAPLAPGNTEIWDNFDNYELLDESSNASSGRSLANNIERERQALAARTGNGVWLTGKLTFTAVEITGQGGPGQRWTKEEIRTGEHLDSFEEL